MNLSLSRRLARLEAAVRPEPLANRPLSLAACNQLRAAIGDPLMTAAEHAAYMIRPPLEPKARQVLLARLLECRHPTTDHHC